MAVLIDPPRWPAHGTVFSHLVSDVSLAELHAFATRAGVPWRAFDHDHYDVPRRLYADLVALGAEPVRETELIRRLLASGLRVRGPARAPKRAAVVPGLVAAWEETLPGAAGIGDELLRHWMQEHRHYHDVRHLAFVLDRLADLDAGPSARPTVLAAWFHDAVHDGADGDDEQASARLAERLLPGLVPTAEVAEVARLVRLTATHDPGPADAAGALLSDADLAILAVVPGRYDVYVRDVRLEYPDLPEERWRAGRLAVLDRLLDRDRLFRTAAGHELWEAAARDNLARERDFWSGPHRAPSARKLAEIGRNPAVSERSAEPGAS
ncbi:DUF4031 domain-containing protein [Propionicicella superfundia]|uniref:DUF4031 domain-containing protein n=1 Tax=Propionicicella superfundia TaxID=348582 RepID=UPI000400BA1E|nr:DUF4031 domain-containing protein [Propionicicella superfundia]